MAHYVPKSTHKIIKSISNEMSYQVIRDGRGDNRLHVCGIVTFFMLVGVVFYSTFLCRMLVNGTLPGDPEVVRDARLSLGGHDFSRSKVEIQEICPKQHRTRRTSSNVDPLCFGAFETVACIGGNSRP